MSIRPSTSTRLPTVIGRARDSGVLPVDFTNRCTTTSSRGFPCAVSSPSSFLFVSVLDWERERPRSWWVVHNRPISLQAEDAQHALIDLLKRRPSRHVAPVAARREMISISGQILEEIRDGQRLRIIESLVIITMGIKGVILGWNKRRIISPMAIHPPPLLGSGRLPKSS